MILFVEVVVDVDPGSRDFLNVSRIVDDSKGQTMTLCMFSLFAVASILMRLLR